MDAKTFQKQNFFVIIAGGLLVLFLLALFLGLASDSIFATTKVPSLVKKPLEESKKLALKSKVKLFVIKRASSDTPENIVISQSPPPGKKVRKNSFVKIVLSKGQKLSSPRFKDEGLKNISLAKIDRENKPKDIPGKKKSEEKVVCIDPGHQSKANLSPEPIGPGSSQTKEKVKGGAVGVNSRTPEYQITLEISLKLKSLLEKGGIRVIMTRESNEVDLSNAQRAKIANEARADLFVRIHADGSNDSKTAGISTLYPGKNQWTENIYGESYQAARIIQEELIKAAGRNDRGIIPRQDLTGFNWSQVPVVLSEVGFLSNPEEDSLLNKEDFQQKIARGLYNGIIKYLKVESSTD